MNIKTKIIIVSVYTAIVFCGAWLLNDYFDRNQEIVIEPGPIVDNHPIVDIDKIGKEQLKKTADCYLNHDATLELTVIDGNTVEAKAGLCERKWSRKFKVRTKRCKNYVMGNIYYPLGGSIGYYRKFLNVIALGGGISYVQENPELFAGILYMW